MKLLIADDHDLLRDTLKSYLEAEGGFEVALASDFEAALQAVEHAGPFDLIMLDVAMPGMNGFKGLERMLAAVGETPVAMMSGSAPPQTAQQALERGAVGFLPKTMPAKSLANAMRLMAGGDRYVPVELVFASLRSSPGKGSPTNVLTQRERDVLTGLCEGKANKEIANDLGLREPTIKLHVKTICRKLDARNRTHAAMLGKESGFC